MRQFNWVPFWITVALILRISTAEATPCEEFTARFMEGAAYYKMPIPKFHLTHVNETDPDWRYFDVTTFNDIRSVMTCRHGNVSSFAVDANNPEGMSLVHVGVTSAVGIYAAGWNWREATAIRDQLVLKAKDGGVADQVIEEAKFAFVISAAGAASFQIDGHP